MRSSLASWSGLLLIACSGSEFAPGGSATGGTAGTAGGNAGTAGGISGASGGASPGAGGKTGVSGGANSGGAGGMGAGGHGAGGASGSGGSGGTLSTGGKANGTGGKANGTGGKANGTGGSVVAVDAGTLPVTACGDAPPDPSAKCSGTFACSYGTDPRPGCRVAYQCSNGTFLVSAPKCTALKSCFTDVTPLPVIGKACTPQGDFCMWDSGLSCSCTPCTGSSCTDPYTWNCAPAASSPCPLVAPNQGQACDASGPSTCTYAGCGIASHVVTRCRNGIWSLEIPSCG